ncbi:MAG: thiamine pyrophosphate-binding protein, partial [Myxococcota bacterium]|nr:thiamine pyrophosphate-binding protein [Myxococcota bacterium]
MTSDATGLWTQTLVGALVAGGVRHAVVSPGSRHTPVVLALDALARAGAVRIHVVLDERTAGFFALGLARVTGQPVALSCTSGSAGAHYLPAVIEASHDRLPLLLLTADRPPELHGVGAPQTTSQGALFGDHVRFA